MNGFFGFDDLKYGFKILTDLKNNKDFPVTRFISKSMLKELKKKKE